jgi:hypothetical protein
MIAAVSIYSIEGLAGMFGRIGFGVAGDRFGAQRVLVIGLRAQAFGVLSYVFVSQLGGFYVVAVAVGFIYAGTMPLYAVMIRKNFPLKMMGTIIGGTGRQSRHVHGAAARRSDLQPLRQLYADVSRLVGQGPGGHADADGVPAVPQEADRDDGSVESVAPGQTCQDCCAHKLRIGSVRLSSESMAGGSERALRSRPVYPRQESARPPTGSSRPACERISR